MRLAPKFVTNPQSVVHCVVSSSLMVANSLDLSFSMEEMESRVDFDPKYHTWFVQAAQALSQDLSGVQLWSVFDFAKFAVEGEAYLKSWWPSEKLQAQRGLASPGFAKEIAATEAFVSKGGSITLLKLTEENLDDFTSAFADTLRKNLVIAQVDHSALVSGKPGRPTYHAVVLYGASDAGTFYFLHDPGPPAVRAMRVEASAFWEAFAGDMILIPHKEIPFGKTFNASDPCYCGSGNKFKNCHRQHLCADGSLK